MNQINIPTEAFPLSDQLIRGRWAPLYVYPLVGSDERLVFGVVVISENDFHVEVANALHRLECLCAEKSDILRSVIELTATHLRQTLSEKGTDALAEFTPVVSGVTLGSFSSSLGPSLGEMAKDWLQSMSSLHIAGTVEDTDVGEDEVQPETTTKNIDRLPNMVFEYVAAHNPELSRFFRKDIRTKARRYKNHEPLIDFSGKKIVANFSTLNASKIASSIDMIKLRLWDLKAARGSEEILFQNTHQHEILIHLPQENDPSISKSSYSRIRDAVSALEEQADTEELRLETFTSVKGIGQRIVSKEAE